MTYAVLFAVLAMQSPASPGDTLGPGDAPASEDAPALGDTTAPPAPAFFDEIVGRWQGEGRLFGAPAEFEMVWQWELDNRFVRLTYSIRGATEMTAIAHYRLSEAEALDGVWVDTRGEILELSATVTARMLETHWRSPSEEGRTTYEVTGTDSFEVRDYVRDGEEWQQFGHASYSRVPKQPG